MSCYLDLGQTQKGMTTLVILKGTLIVSYREHNGDINRNKQTVYLFWYLCYLGIGCNLSETWRGI